MSGGSSSNYPDSTKELHEALESSISYVKFKIAKPKFQMYCRCS